MSGVNFKIPASQVPTRSDYRKVSRKHTFFFIRITNNPTHVYIRSFTYALLVYGSYANVHTYMDVYSYSYVSIHIMYGFILHALHNLCFYKFVCIYSHSYVFIHIRMYLFNGLGRHRYRVAPPGYLRLPTCSARRVDV